jgi:hypothetical protein
VPTTARDTPDQLRFATPMVSRAVAPRSSSPAALHGCGANGGTQIIDHFQRRRSAQSLSDIHAPPHVHQRRGRGGGSGRERKKRFSPEREKWEADAFPRLPRHNTRIDVWRDQTTPRSKGGGGVNFDFAKFFCVFIYSFSDQRELTSYLRRQTGWSGETTIPVMCLGDLGSPFAPPFQRSDLPVTYRHFRRFLGWSGETAIPVVCLGQCGNASAPLMFGLADDPTFGGLAIRSNVSSETFIPVMCLGHRGSPLAPSVRGQTKSERRFGERGSDRASSAANSPGRLQKRNKPDFPSLLQSWIHVPTMPPFQVVPHRMPPVGCRRRRPPPFLFCEQTQLLV